MPIISPSILACDFLNLEDEIKRLNDTNAQWLHLDVMDGHFVPNLTFGYDLISRIHSLTTKVLDTHLMISNPLNYIEKYADAGSDYITFHIEIEEDINQVIDKIKACGKKAGLAIKPNTDIELILPYLEKIDLVLVMSVEPGFGGQQFISSTPERINLLSQIREEKGYNYVINVDGGINDQTAPLCNESDVLVSGSYLFKGDLQTNIDSLQS